MILIIFLDILSSMRLLIVKALGFRSRRRNLKMAYSLWKRIRCFPSTLRWGNLKTCNTHRSFWICIWGTLGQVNHMIIMTPSLLKSSGFNICFLSTRKRKAHVFSFLRFERRLRKAPFSWRSNVDGRPNRRNKAPFSWWSNVDGRPYRRNKTAFSNSTG